MSTQQRNDACLITVDPLEADVLRHQTLVVLEANHHYFEDVRDFGPEAQFALSVIYRDAFAVLDAVGWSGSAGAAEPVGVPLTAGHVGQLWRRRRELGHTNIDRVEGGGDIAAMRPAIDAARVAAQVLDRLIGACGVR
jgi:hypothetical protein